MQIKDATAGMQSVLSQHSEVVYADLNLLWVTIKPRQGLIKKLAIEIQQRVLGAKLVGGLPPTEKLTAGESLGDLSEL